VINPLMLRPYLGTKLPVGVLSHVQQEIAPFSRSSAHVVHSSAQSSAARRFLRDLHGCRPLSRLQELQVLQALREGRRKMWCLQMKLSISDSESTRTRTIFLLVTRHLWSIVLCGIILVLVPTICWAKTYLTIRSEPPGASVEIDGIVVGQTPYSIEILGSYVHGGRSTKTCWQAQADEKENRK
jgi:hypothetical protein